MKGCQGQGRPSCFTVSLKWARKSSQPCLCKSRNQRPYSKPPQRNMSPRWQAGRVERTAEVETWRKQVLLFLGVIQGPVFLPDSVGVLGL